MSKYWLITLLLTYTVYVHGQVNLVPNPSFEDTLNCPNLPTPNISSCLFWDTYGGTPDYFNPCANYGPFFGVPYNIGGYQIAYNGESYCGFLTWSVVPGVIPNREFIGVKLIDSLQIGTKYFVSCYISNSDTIPNNSSTNKICFRFSNIEYTYLVNPPVDNFAHICEDSIVYEKSSWKKIGSTFIADSNYKYLIIGNFYQDSLTKIDSLPPYSQALAYYYIDAVCVTTDSSYDAVWTSITNNTASEEIFFPNPANEFLNFENNLNNTHFAIYNIVGKQILCSELVKGFNQINTGSIAAGFYILITDKAKTFRFIVQH
nr:T9SS type A sorting domain-containing protein [Bacteroidota bacterium]